MRGCRDADFALLFCFFFWCFVCSVWCVSMPVPSVKAMVPFWFRTKRKLGEKKRNNYEVFLVAAIELLFYFVKEKWFISFVHEPKCHKHLPLKRNGKKIVKKNNNKWLRTFRFEICPKMKMIFQDIFLFFHQMENKKMEQWLHTIFLIELENKMTSNSEYYLGLCLLKSSLIVFFSYKNEFLHRRIGFHFFGVISVCIFIDFFEFMKYLVEQVHQYPFYWTRHWLVIILRWHT